jgi:asparagine synthase (glutamine-hydrolysing)
LSAIFGIFYLDGRPVAPEILEGMKMTLSHRGPDGSAVWREGPVGLGHLMLHMTPESLHESLPLKNASGDLVITADARIDNREELFEVLAVPHPERTGMPDSTLILRAYEKWGEECPKHLLGDFVFAVWDGRKRQLFCARDQIGLKVLYYHHSHRFIAFASEIKAVLAVPDVPCRLNEIAVADFLVHNEQDLEITFYEKISRLPPAHILVLNTGEMKISRYWIPEIGPELKLSSDEEYAQALRELMFQAVHCRMRSPFPVGVSLSGGLDSSSVACIAARKLREKGKRLIAVSSALPDKYSGIEKDEREYIEEVRIQEDNIDVEYVLAEGATPFDDLESQFRHIDQPFRDLFYYMSDALYAAARKYEVRILLNGFGGDIAASFYGKGYPAQLGRTGHWLKLARLLRQRAVVERRSPWAILKGEVLGVLAPSYVLRFYRRLKGNSQDVDWISRTAIHPAFALRVDIKERCRKCGHSLEYRVPPDARAMMLMALSSPNLAYPLEGIATAQAYFGLEQVHPLLDRRIIEFCLKIPPAQFVRNGWRRSLMRRAMEGVLPAKIQWRSTKHPFTPDYHSRVLRAKHRVLRFLSEAAMDEHSCQYVDRTKIERQLERLKPVKGWNEWENDTPIIVGKGIMIESFTRWFTLTAEHLK